MQNIMEFNNEEFGTVRTCVIDSEPWFVGKDVARALGYGDGKSLNNAVANHVDEEDKGVTEMMTPGGKQNLVIINESGLYSLILSSKLPSAKQFKRWVTSEVLPSIRQNGGYIIGQNEKTEEELMAEALKVANKVLARREARIKALEAEKAKMQPKANYFDALVDKSMLTNITNTAKEFGMKPKDLTNWLISHNYVYREKPKKNNGKGRVMPHSKYTEQDTGSNKEAYFSLKEFTTDSFAGNSVYITPKGKSAFQLMLKAEGII